MSRISEHTHQYCPYWESSEFILVPRINISYFEVFIQESIACGVSEYYISYFEVFIQESFACGVSQYYISYFEVFIQESFACGVSEYYIGLVS